MGNIVQGSFCQKEKIEMIEQHVSRIGTATICQFGTVQLYKNDITNQCYFSHDCEFLISDDRKSHNTYEMLKRINNSCPNLINIWKILPKDQIQGCNGRRKITVFFQYLPMTLKQVIEGRRSPFPEREIYRIMRSLLVGVKQLNSRQSYHGDISPEFIYFDSQAVQKYKIFDPIYFSPTRSGYYRAQSQLGYCAPQILANLSEKRIYPLYNHYICDTFSIGLVILYCMTLIDPLVAYRNSKKQIDFYYIESLLRVALRNNYSEGLLACVRECLLLKNRPTVSEVLSNYSFLNSELSLEEEKFSLKKY